MPHGELLAEGRASVGLYATASVLCTQQLNWCAVDESCRSRVYAMSTAAVGRAILLYNSIGNNYICTRNRSDLNHCLQSLALIILKLGMIKVAVSNWNSKKYVMKLLRFESHA